MRRRIAWLLQTPSPILWVTICWAVGLLSLWWFGTRIEALTNELYLYGLLLVYYAMTLVGLIAIVRFLVQRLRSSAFTLLAVVSIFVITVWLLTKLPDFEVNYYFWSDRPERDTMAAIIQHGQLPPDPYPPTSFNPNFLGELVRLPKGHEYLSQLYGGDVFVSRQNGAVQIAFVNYPGWFGELTAYIYRSDDRPPIFPYPKRDPIVRVQRLDDHWYWLSLNDNWRVISGEFPHDDEPLES